METEGGGGKTSIFEKKLDTQQAENKSMTSLKYGWKYGECLSYFWVDGALIFKLIMYIWTA